MDTVHIIICCSLCLGQIILAYGVFKQFCKKSECCEHCNIINNNNNNLNL